MGKGLNKGSHLSTLLNYRFVRKVEKIPKENHSQDSDSSSQETDSQKTIENESQSPPTNGSRSQSPATSGSQSPSTNGSRSQSPATSGSQSPATSGSQSPATSEPQSPPTTPEKLKVSVQTPTVPETPNSQIPSAPSPVFQPKIRTGKRKLDELSDSEGVTNSNELASSEKSRKESPWLSKSERERLNGFVEDNKSASKFVDKSRKRAQDLDHMRSVFPGGMLEDLNQSLDQAGGDIESAVEIQHTKYKLQDSSQEQEDLQSPIINQTRKKFRRIMSSDSDDASEKTGPDSQSSDSTRLDSQTMEERISFLVDVFPNFNRQRVTEALNKHVWSVEDATVDLSNAMDKADKVEDSEIDMENNETEEANDEDEEDEEDEEEEDVPQGSDEKGMMLSFFQEATQEELMTAPGCSKKKTELIINLRPFQSWEELVRAFEKTKGLTYDLISGCKEIIHVREVIIRLMERCENIGKQMGGVVSDLMEDSEESSLRHCNITRQPTCLNSEMQLKPFQMVGLNWLRILHDQQVNGILADEMGLGKTIQAIAFLGHLLDIDEKGPHLIVVPSSTIDNWVRELKLWCPKMNVLLYYGSQEERTGHRESIYDESNDYHVVLTTYNMATGNLKDRIFFKKFYFQYAIFDEGHLLKNMSSSRYQHLMKIQADNRLLLTGTPLQNNLLELMSLLCFVMPDMFIGKTEQLKRMFMCYSRTNEERRSRFEEERIAHAKRIMQPFVLRRLKSEVLKQLPAKVERIEFCAMIPDQQELYDTLVQQFRDRLKTNVKQIISSGAGMLMQLRKIANHPLLHRRHYTDDKLRIMAAVLSQEPSHALRGALPELIFEDLEVMSDFELHSTCQLYKSCLGEYFLDKSLVPESAKFRVLDDLLQSMKSNGDRVLLFSQFTMMMDIMEVYLKQKDYKYLRLDGRTPVPERQKLIDEYNCNEDIFIFMLSTKAGGMGINLTAANVVILHDIDFNPYNDKQAEDRCHRVGQTKEVTVIRLICKNTVEDAMLRCAREKLKLERDITTSDTDNSSKSSADVVKLLKEALLVKNVDS